MISHLAEKIKETDRKQLFNPNPYFRNLATGRKNHCTVHGGLALAIRRCTGNISLGGVGMTLAMDVHRSSLSRWEIRLRAARLASMRAWYRHMYQETFDNCICFCREVDVASDPAADGAFAFAVYGLECDATNSNMWKSFKLHSCMVLSMVCTRSIRKDDNIGILESYTKKRQMMADIQLMAGSSGPIAVALTHKHCRRAFFNSRKNNFGYICQTPPLKK